MNGAEKLARRFEKYLEYVDRHPNQKFTKEDIGKIMAFHRPGYLEAFSSMIKIGQKTREDSARFLANLKTYTSHNMELVQSAGRQADLLNAEIKKHSNLLVQDINTLKKYVGFMFRLRAATGSI